jgi:hypothetical protein
MRHGQRVVICTYDCRYGWVQVRDRDTDCEYHRAHDRL